MDNIVSEYTIPARGDAFAGVIAATPDVVYLCSKNNDRLYVCKKDAVFEVPIMQRGRTTVKMGHTRNGFIFFFVGHIELQKEMKYGKELHIQAYEPGVGIGRITFSDESGKTIPLSVETIDSCPLTGKVAALLDVAWDVLRVRKELWVVSALDGPGPVTETVKIDADGVKEAAFLSDGTLALLVKEETGKRYETLEVRIITAWGEPITSFSVPVQYKESWFGGMQYDFLVLGDMIRVGNGKSGEWYSKTGDVLLSPVDCNVMVTTREGHYLEVERADLDFKIQVKKLANLKQPPTQVSE